MSSPLRKSSITRRWSLSGWPSPTALYRLRMEAPVRRRFLDDPAAFVEEFGLDADERAALEALDESQLQKLGVHPLLAFLARLQVDIERRART